MKPRSKFYFWTLALIASAIAFKALWIPLKAYYAHWLIEQSWSHTLETGAKKAPWPWADHHALVKFNFPSANTSTIALMGADPSSLAFAPGVMHEYANTNQTGALVVAAHNDTHFSFLPRLNIGDRIIMVNNQNREYTYIIDQLKIIDTTKQRLALSKQDNRLLLVTCFPFDSSLENSSQRFVVSAVPVSV